MQLRLEQFSGIAPKVSRQQLPPNMATSARNCRLLSGELRGLHEPKLVHTFSSTTNYAVRIPNTPTDTWVGFSQVDIDFAKGPLVNDAYDRYYWTGENSYLTMNTKTRIAGGSPSYKVGTPSPTTASITINVTGGDPELVETRAYTYTFVNEYGEESAPAEPTIASGPADGTWELSSLQAADAAADMTGRSQLVETRIYRTVTGQSSALYYYVTTIATAATSHDDTSDSSEVVLNNILETFDWDVPPTTLKGLTAHPAGFFAAFNGREVFFSEPYRPWAWPVSYILAVEHDIVGLAVYGNMLMVMTESNPYYFSGTHPSNISPTQSQSVEPCLSKRGIVATLQGVLYPSPNGLVLFNQAGANVVTYSILSRDEWSQGFSPSTIKAAQRGMQYLAFYDDSNGFEFSPAEPLGQFSTLDRFSYISNILTDRYTGDVYLISNDRVFQWDDPTQKSVYYTWVSKEFDFPRPVNLAAAIVKMDLLVDSVPEIPQADEKEAWNAVRMTEPLHPIGFTAIGMPRREELPPVGFPADPYDEMGAGDRRVYPIGGSPLFITDPSFVLTSDVVYLKVYADRKLVATLAARPNQTMRLPSGFKAHFWQFELTGNVDVYSVAVAETAKSLMNV